MSKFFMASTRIGLRFGEQHEMMQQQGAMPPSA
jgi:hypothetical protein